MMKYFTREEEKETLTSGKKFNSSEPVTIRSYTYKSGAVYEGEWMGGMRHGKGKILWVDGASYKGDW